MFASFVFDQGVDNDAAACCDAKIRPSPVHPFVEGATSRVGLLAFAHPFLERRHFQFSEEGGGGEKKERHNNTTAEREEIDTDR